MTDDVHHFTSITFRNFKALKTYSVSLTDFNILVGPNNSGKSTIIGALRILAEGMRKALRRNPEYLRITANEEAWGYRVPLEDLPIATENIFSDYDDSQPAVIEFKLSNGNRLILKFPESNLCYLLCQTVGPQVRSTKDFKREYKASVGFVPVLGPVEHNETLNQKETARRALLTHRASRNFRNIWYYDQENFDEFRELICSTWPGMDIKKPEIDRSHESPVLHMFCPEGRFPREIFWAGFGFQVWCQMLTYIVLAKKDSLLVIDEPDIYLHSDLQRQLVGLLKNIGSDIVIATHSTEIISEADPNDLLVINKKARSAKRIKNPSQLQSIFGVLGSNLNPTLTQLAKTRRAIFVEGKDFNILGAFARRLNKNSIANKSDFAVIPAEGFDPKKVSNMSEGMESILGAKLLKAVIFDRDYRSSDEVTDVLKQLNKFSDFSHIHERKEIENYLLNPLVLDRALTLRIAEHNKRTNDNVIYDEKAENILGILTDKLKTKINSQFLARRSQSEKVKKPGLDTASINQKLLEEFDKIWSSLPKRLEVAPGKEVFSELNTYIQERYKVTLTPATVIHAMEPQEVPKEIKNLLDALDAFRLKNP